jgi:hypothetical protein
MAVLIPDLYILLITLIILKMKYLNEDLELTKIYYCMLTLHFLDLLRKYL